MVLESPVRLKSRLALHADLEQCRTLLPDWLPLDERVRDALPRIWTRLLFQPAFNARVVEDLSHPRSDNLVALCMSVALDDTWRRRLRADPPSFVAAHVYRALLDGSFTPPTDAELGTMNAAGTVTFLALHYAQKTSDLSDSDAMHMLSASMSAFRLTHSGYRLDALYQEGIGPELGFMTNMGFRLYTQRAGDAGHAPGHPDHPELLGLSRDDAANLLPGTPVRDIFQFTPPVLGLSASERRLLRLAIEDLPDERIAEELGLTANTIKKLWRSIHERVGTRLPELHFVEQAANGKASTDTCARDTRGPEKRRILLPYLRQHPEELRPFAG